MRIEFVGKGGGGWVQNVKNKNIIVKWNVYLEKKSKTVTCEPSVAQVSHSYFRHLPALGRFFTEKLNFHYKVDPLNLESQNHGLSLVLKF